jgi:hypothetical protein
MRSIGLMVTPGGNGYEDISVAAGTTVAQVIEKYDLFNRTISVDNVEIPPEKYKTTLLDDIDEIWATGGAKGA